VGGITLYAYFDGFNFTYAPSYFVVRTGFEPVFYLQLNLNITLYDEVLTQFHFILKRLPFRHLTITDEVQLAY
jgi:hypothetical protein